MATKITDSAMAKLATQNLDSGIDNSAKKGETNTPKEKTTAERLFPEFITEDGGIINRPIKPYQDESKPLPVSSTSAVEDQGQKPVAQAPTAPVYLKPEELTGKMVKLKVDGIEQDVPAESLIKTNQLERHLNSQLMKLAQERVDLEKERAALIAKSQTQAKDDAKPTQTPKKAEAEALEAELAMVKAQMASLQQAMLPAIQEAGIKRVEQMAKERLGADDFRSYFDRIRDNAMSEMAKPENATNPQAQAYFDSDTFYFQKYQELKLRDLMAAPKPTEINPKAPVLKTEGGAPVIISNSGKPVSIPALESSGGVPSKISNEASWQSTYSELLSRAQKTGSTEDWTALYRHKMTSRE